MVTNLLYFFETAKKVRGGRWVWVKDGNGENRSNILLGGTLANPNKGFGHIWAAQLLQYIPGQPILLFRSFAISKASTGTTLYIKGDGFSDAPEVGQVIMVAPDDATTKGQSAKITNVVYDESAAEFTVTIDTALSASALAADTILVEAKGTAASDEAEVLCPKPNIFNEADRDLLPTEGYGIENANYAISGVYHKEAWIAKMQPLPKYVLAYNKSLIDGIFEI